MLPYSRQWIDEDDISAVNEVLRSDWITQGEKVAEFEQALCDYTGAGHAIAVASGTAALHLCCLALELNEEHSGVTSPISFAASANCLRYVGAGVKFGDVDKNNGLLDTDTCPDANIAIPVSLSGAVADLPAFRSRYPWVIEDAAHSLGADYGTVGASFKSASCQHTDAAILSFHPVKNICTGEGGAVTTNDRELAERIKLLRSHGIQKTNTGPSWFYDQVELGMHYRMTDIQAALGISQLKKLDSFIIERRKRAAFYSKEFQAPEFAETFATNSFNPQSAYHLYTLNFVNEDDRDQAYDFLRSRSISSQVHYKPIYQHTDFQKNMREMQTRPGAEHYSKHTLSIPLFPKMTDEDQNRVIESLKFFCKTNH